MCYIESRFLRSVEVFCIIDTISFLWTVIIIIIITQDISSYDAEIKKFSVSQKRDDRFVGRAAPCRAGSHGSQ